MFSSYRPIAKVDLVLGGQPGRSGGHQLLGGHLPLEGELGEVVELFRVRVAGGPELVALPGRGQSFAAPFVGGGQATHVLILGHAKVADGLRDRGLGLADVLRVVPDHPVQHLLRVFRSVQEGVQVRLGQLATRAKILCFTTVFLSVTNLHPLCTAPPGTGTRRVGCFLFSLLAAADRCIGASSPDVRYIEHFDLGGNV
ncbi:MAG: hypothetical protein NVSMB43_24000 [Pseudarthrobacter sp.]